MKERTHKVLLVWVVGVEQMDETTHEALLFSKIFRVWVISRLVWLVLDQRGYQVQDGVHLQENNSLLLTQMVSHTKEYFQRNGNFAPPK